MAQKQAASKPNEIRIKEDTPSEDYFRRTADPYVLPPEVNMTVKDGFRFGIGFILASLIFYVIVLIGVVVIVRFGRLVGLG